MNIISNLRTRKLWHGIKAWGIKHGLATAALLVSIISLTISINGRLNADNLTREEKRSAALYEAWKVERMFKAYYIAVSNYFYTSNISKETLDKLADHVVNTEYAVELIESVRKDLYKEKISEGSADLENICGRLKILSDFSKYKFDEWRQEYGIPEMTNNYIEQGVAGYGAQSAPSPER